MSLVRVEGEQEPAWGKAGAGLERVGDGGARDPGTLHHPVGFSTVRESLVRSPSLRWERENHLQRRLTV